MDIMQYFVKKLRTSPHLSERSDWIVWGVFDANCQSCEGPLLLACAPINPSYPSDVVLICSSCENLLQPIQLDSDSRNLLQDRFEFVQDRSLDDASNRLSSLINVPLADEAGQVSTLPEGVPEASSKSMPKVLRASSDSKEMTGEVSVPVPDGYKSVAWVRPYEAEAIIESIVRKRGVEIRDEKGELVLTCRYVSPDSSEAKKFHSCCQVVRFRARGPRVLGWIREEEARAILEAIQRKETVEFKHKEYGMGGRVEFYDPEGPAARTFLSPTRLLRKY